MTNPNVAMMRRYADAWLRGDLETAKTFYADDYVLHYFGSNPLSGDYVGAAGVEELVTKFYQNVDNVEVIEDIDIIASDKTAAWILLLRVEREGKVYEGSRVDTFRLENGKIVEEWVHDQPELEAFLSRSGGGE